MLRAIRVAVPAVLLLVALPPSLKAAPLTDRSIGLAVETELLSSEAVDAHRIDAQARDGIVTLSGKVDNLLAQRRAAKVAQQVKGVRSVINQIIVLASGRADSAIEEDIRRAWASEEATESIELEASVDGGKAKISGQVDSRAERILAGQIAAGVRGVVDIENSIGVTTPPERPDSEIQSEIETLLKGAVVLDDASIQTEVENGTVTLSGQVGSAYARTVALQKAWVSGVKSVDVRSIRVNPDQLDGTLRHERMSDVTDESIENTIRLALSQDPRVLSYLDSIEITSEDAAVTLFGKVGRLRVKKAAEKVAAATTGVWRVKNHLKVRWADEDPPAQEIIDYVQTALKRDPYVSRHEIRVHCRNGHVSLYGLVDSKFEKQAAGWIAGGQKGVVHVNNALAVAQEWEPKSDAAIKAAIEEKLAFTFFDKSNDIDVTVEDGVAILRGKVDTWLAWQTAMNKAIEAGARRPHNLLEVRYHPQHGGRRIYVPQ